MQTVLSQTGGEIQKDVPSQKRFCEPCVSILCLDYWRRKSTCQHDSFISFLSET